MNTRTALLRITRHLVILVASSGFALAATAWPPATLGQPAATPKLQPHLGANKMYLVYTPADWRVSEDAGAASFQVLVESPARTSRVEFRWERNVSGRTDAVVALAEWRRTIAQTYPGATLGDMYVSKDGSHAVATLHARVANAAVAGRFFFESTRAGNSFQGYVAPEARLVTERPLLLNVMSSLAFVKVLHNGGGLQPPVRFTLVARRAQDGSLTMKTPQDWNFLAAQGRVITGSPGGGMGFIFTAFAGNPMLPRAGVLQGVIGRRFLRPAQTLPVILTGFGHRNPEILSNTPDQATMAQCPSRAGNRCDAADMMAQWTSKDGVDCVGAFKVVNLLPGFTDQWSSILAGLWGPRKDFYRYYAALEEVGSSFAIDDQYARSYIQTGLANLRRLKEQTAAEIQSLNKAREDNQAAWEARQERKDYMDSKWDDYRRGQSYWVSDLEGGKVYATGSSGTKDTVTGDYYEGQGFNWTNFEGQNPRHPSENMREVSSWELEHGRPPR
jgi:hypothetical protein